MRHDEQFLIIWPGDGQEKSRFSDCFNVVLDRSAKSEETSSLQVIYLPLCLITERALQHLHRACAVCMVFFYSGGRFHTNQNNPKVLLFEKSLGVNPFGPRFVTLELGHFMCQVKLRKIGYHRPVVCYKWSRHAPAFLLKRVRSRTASLCTVSFAA